MVVVVVVVVGVAGVGVGAGVGAGEGVGVAARVSVVAVVAASTAPTDPLEFLLHLGRSYFSKLDWFELILHESDFQFAKIISEPPGSLPNK